MKQHKIPILIVLIFILVATVVTTASGEIGTNLLANSFYINAGGGDYTDGGGNLFVADKVYVAGDFGYVGGQAKTYSGPIAGTTDSPLYEDTRLANASFSYVFDTLPADTYEITLYFMEPQANSPGQRVFDISVEGAVVLDDYDTYAAAGGKKIAVNEVIIATVSDGQLNIDFVESIPLAKPIVSAIAVVPTTPPTPEPDISVAPTSVDFGNVETGTTSDMIVTVSNVGTADLNVSALNITAGEFTIISPATPVVITPFNSADVTVRFSPTAIGLQSGDLEITSDDPDEGLVTVPLSGNGTPPPPNEPDINVSPSSLDYGQVVVGSTKDLNLTVENLGLQTLTVSDLTATNATFTVVSPAVPFDVLSGGSQDVVVRFTPVSETVEAGDFEITSNDPDEGLVTVALSGEGVLTPPVAFRINAGGSDYTDSNSNLFVADKLYTAGDFGYTGGKAKFYAGPIAGTIEDPLYENTRVAGSSFSYTFDVPNGNYEAILHFMEPGSNGSTRIFDVTVEGVVVLPSYNIFSSAGGSLTAVTESLFVDVTDGQLNIDFSGAKPIVSAIEVVSTAPPTPEPDINVLPTSLDFGDVEENTTSDMIVTVSNVGTVDLNVSALNITAGEFTVVSPATAFVVSSGSSQDVTVRFSPTSVGAQAGDLEISSDDPDEGLVTVPLTGNGTTPPPNEPDINVTPTSLNFGQVVVGNTADQIITVENDGLQTLTVSDLTMTNGAFTVVSPATPFDVVAGGSQDVTVRFSPASESVENGDLDITSNDPDEGLVTVSLTGEGVLTPPVAFRINAGGSDYTDGSGNLFVADKAYSAGDFGYSGGLSKNYPGAVAGTTDDLLYEDLRLDNVSFSYLFDLPNGSYQLILHFMEPTSSSPGGRVFDVSAEGVVVLPAYDIYVAAGDTRTAVTEALLVDVTDGQLNLDFVGGIKPIVSAIEVVQATNEPDINVSPASLDFGQVEVNNDSSKILSLSNTGLVTLTVSSIVSTDSHFTLIDPIGAFEVAPGGLQYVTVQFSPDAAAIESGDFEITSDDPNEGLVVVPVTGEGVFITGATYQEVAADVGFVLSHDYAAICTPETNTPIGSGSAWADYDNDGDIDLFVTNHGGANYLYRNDGDTDSDGLPNFVDEAAAMGVDDPTGVGHSAVFIDYDNDGDQDLYVTNWGANNLYQNQLIESGSVSFVDVTAVAGVADGGRGVTTAWADYDNDGHLDFYIAKHKYCLDDSMSEDHLYHNNGDGTFTDVTTFLCGGASVCNQTDAYGFSPGWFDYDNDGDQDLYVVNDRLDDRFDYNTLWRNDGPDGVGGWLFTDVSAAAGVDLSVHGMGLGIGDYDNDGWYDVAFSDVGPSHLLRNNGDGTFADTSDVSGVTDLTNSLTWGTAFFDYNNDQWSDLLIVAGWLMESPVAFSNFLLENNADGTFTDVSVSSGVADTGRARSASIVDFDGDGWVDFYVGNLGEAPLLYHNVSSLQGNTNHWLNFTVEGTESNRDGIGTRIYVTAGTETMMRDITSGPTHGGGDYRAAYFGLGAETEGTVEVHWPNGVVENLGTITADQQLHLVEPPFSFEAATFTDVTAATGIVQSHELGATCAPPLGSGAAWADYDDDGDIDLFVTNRGGANHLYRNDGDTSSDGIPDFTDVAVSMGVDDPTGVGHAATFIDYDNDGDQDLYVTNWGGNTLYENQLIETGSVSFIDVTGTAGVADDGRAITAAWGDYDNDSYLDLYVAKHHTCGGDFLSTDHLYHNNGDGTFTDVTSYLCGGASSCFEVDGLGFSPGWLDYDNDGDPDLYLVNDSNGSVASNVLWRNDGSDGSGGWLFTDVSAAAGVDFTVNGMGLGVGDYDNDGWLDLAFSDIGPAHLLQNNGDGTYTDASAASGITALTGTKTWGTVFFDHNNDMWLDLFIVAGNTGVEPGDSYPNYFLGNLGNGTFTDLSSSSGLDNDGRGRAAAIADFDQDGFVDVFVGNYGESPVLYHNDGNSSNWLAVTVEGTVSNRDGIGTRLYLTAGGVTQMREISSGPTHGGGDYRAAYFGLGSEAQGTLEVHWPNGIVENLGVVTADQQLHLVEPASLGPTYVDVAADVGLVLSHEVDAGICDPALGSGSAWADYDNDGDIDFFVTNHGGANHLYRNDGDTDSDGLPNFTDVAAALGVDDPTGIGHGAVFIDYDNDGDQDLYVSNWGDLTDENVLYQNQLIETGTENFVDVTTTAGLDDNGRGITAAWADFDNDGYLDLYTAKYQKCFGDPESTNHLYHNNGDGTFTDVTSYLCGGAATCAANDGYSFTAGWFDYDNDNDQDLYLVNDKVGGGAAESALWRNDGSDGSGGWLFTDVSVSSGSDYGVNAMGLGIGDYDNDGDFDFAFSDIGPGHLAQNNGDGTFTEVSGASGVTAATDSPATWGTAFFDYNNDGWIDLFFVAGGTGGPDITPNFLLNNQGDGTFSDVSVSAGVDHNGRGRNGSIVDFDGDGFVDIFLHHYDEAPILFHNKSAVQGNSNHWLSITVEGTESNRDGIGTRIYLTASGITQMREINSGPTHGGGDYRAAYFGLGTETSGTVEVHWPNGEVENLGVISADQQLHLIEPVSGGPTYVDVTAAVGIVQSHDFGATCNPPMGSGAAWADYDNDGDIDLFVTNRGGANHLYRNDGDTNSDGIPDFTDVAVAMGVDDPTGVGHAATFIDYDNDGDQDLYVTNWGGNTLYENQLVESGSVSFTDVTGTAGVADDGRAITTAWGDFDNDSFLDLYVAKHHTCSGDFLSTDHLYRNNGDGTFTDVTSYLCGGASTCFEVEGLGFAPGWLDYDNDGDPDLYLVNDSNGSIASNVLWRNDGSDGSGGWLFTDVSAAAGVDFTVNGMGLGIGDYNNDGWLDLAFSDIGPAHLIQNNGDGTYTDASAASGVTALTGSKTWGTVFFDHDNDMWLDLFVVAGNTGVEPGDSYPNYFMGNQGDGTFVDLSASSGLDNDGRGRAAAIADFDEDGFVDVFLANIGQAPVLYHNEGNSNNWLSITVEGTESNRDGIGTRIYLTAGGVTQMREISSGPTHGGGDYRAAYFGLGSETAGTVVVHWPNGVVENLGTVTGDQALHLVEPASVSGPTYSNVTTDVGINHTHQLDNSDCLVMLGSGSAWADYDNDGDVDLFVTNHGGANYLYRNDGDTDSDGLPNFTDEAVAMGVDDPTGNGLSAVFIDYDNDGDQDLYLTNLGGNTLYENQLIETSSVSFVDVTGTAGIGDAGRAITTAWADYDNDGFLDLYITKHKNCNVAGDFQSQDHLFHNEGDGTFTDVTSYLCGGASTCFNVEGFGFAPGWFDYDNDGDQDLYLANDSNGSVASNLLWRNDGSDGSGGWIFTDVSAASGTDFIANSMGLGIGDYDNDGHFDIAFSDMGPANLLHNEGDGTFTDASGSSNVTALSDSLHWGTVFFDYNNDQWLDLYLAAGNTGAGGFPNILLENQADGTFSDVSVSSGLDEAGRARNASIVDFDGDGFVDVFVGNFGGAPALFHNDSVGQGNSNHWLSITVEGTESNRDGIGTRIYATAGGVTMMRDITTGPTHGGGDYRAAYFGLGSETSATVTVNWPNGEVENLGVVTGDQALHLVEPASPPASPTAFLFNLFGISMVSFVMISRFALRPRRS